MSLSNKKLELLLIILIGLIAVAPHIWATIKTPPGYYFIGVNLNSNLNDVQGVYLPAILNFSGGDWLYRNPYDPTQKAIFHYPVYLLLGKIAQVFNLKVWVVYLLSIFILTLLLSKAIFMFLGLFFSDFKKKVLAFGLAFFGGWYFFGVPEGIGIFSTQFPHFLAAQVALFMCLYVLLKVFRERRVGTKRLLIVFFSSLTVSSIHPWMMVPLVCFFIIFGVCSGFYKKPSLFFPLLVVFLVTSLPFLVYFSKTIPWVNFELNNQMFILPRLYGFYLIAVFVGISWTLGTKHKLLFRPLILWVFVQLLFFFLPFPFRKRFLEGLYLPFCVFAVLGVDWLIDFFKLKKWSNLMYWNAFIYISLAAIVIFCISFIWLPNSFVYKRQTEREAYEFLGKNADGKVVLSLPFSGNHAPSEVRGIISYIGHGIQTSDFYAKETFAQSFFSGDIAEGEAWDKLRAENICFVFADSPEKGLGRDFTRDGNFLVKVFENKDVTIYKRRDCL